jgi:hypothetical protein
MGEYTHIGVAYSLTRHLFLLMVNMAEIWLYYKFYSYTHRRLDGII